MSDRDRRQVTTHAQHDHPLTVEAIVIFTSLVILERAVGLETSIGIQHELSGIRVRQLAVVVGKRPKRLKKHYSVYIEITMLNIARKVWVGQRLSRSDGSCPCGLKREHRAERWRANSKAKKDLRIGKVKKTEIIIGVLAKHKVCKTHRPGRPESCHSPSHSWTCVRSNQRCCRSRSVTGCSGTDSLSCPRRRVRNCPRRWRI